MKNVKTKKFTNNINMTLAKPMPMFNFTWMALINYVLYCWNHIANYRYFKILVALDVLLGMKRINQLNALNGSLRRDALFFVSRGCQHSIFDHKLKYVDKGALMVTTAGNLVLKKDCEYKKDGINFLLTDKFQPKSGYKCSQIDMSFAQFMNKSVILSYNRIFSYILEKKLPSFRYKEIVYNVTNMKNLTIHEFETVELFKKIETVYKDHSVVMDDLNEMLYEIVYKYSTREEYADDAVKRVMEYLVKRRILKKLVDLEEFPDILQLIMPFDLVLKGYNHWGKVENKALGFDLREVEKSDLSVLFNMDVVRKYIKSGGIYIVNAIVYYGQN